jgi:hypothetical protein
MRFDVLLLLELLVVMEFDYFSGVFFSELMTRAPTTTALPPPC